MCLEEPGHIHPRHGLRSLLSSTRSSSTRSTDEFQGTICFNEKGDSSFVTFFFCSSRQYVVEPERPVRNFQLHRLIRYGGVEEVPSAECAADRSEL